MRLLCLGADTVNALISLHAPFDDLTPAGLWGTTYHLVGMSDDQRDVLRQWGLELEDVTPDALQAAAASAAPRPETRTGARTGASNGAGRGAATRSRAASEPAPSPAWVEATPPNESAAETPATTGGASTAVGAGGREEADSAASSAAAESAELESAGAETARGEEREPEPAMAAAPADSSRAETEVGLATTAGADSRESGEDADEEWSYLDGDQLRDGLRLRTRLGGKRVEGRVSQGKVVLDGRTFDSPREASRSLTPNATEREIWEYFDEDARKWYMLDREWQAV